ncbi:SnoaL-like domain-containing protein [Gaetbulibacter sp. M235]|uniref:nuclear transport factor 2 family protein n=1 Tax=Gaetbulibacter sp. M235 TaxID=3126510 RepID=UPI00374F2903
MPTIKRLEEFIAKVETNKHDEAIEEFYDEDASIQENQSLPRIGKSNLVKNEKKVLARAKSVHSKCLRPVFINGNYVVIRWKFQFNWLDGTVTEIEEISYQHWDEEHILEEKFFYDPIQLHPK